MGLSMSAGTIPRTFTCGDCLYEIVVPAGAKLNDMVMKHIRDSHS